jgi:hypothetical protein
MVRVYEEEFCVSMGFWSQNVRVVSMIVDRMSRIPGQSEGIAT